MRYAEDRPLVGKIMIILIMSYWRQQQKTDDGDSHQSKKNEYATTIVWIAGHHSNTIAKAVIEVRMHAPKSSCSGIRSWQRSLNVRSSATGRECVLKNPAHRRPPARPR